MGVVPKTESEMLQFFESRAALWSADPLAIGLTLDQSTAITASVGEARARFDAAYNAYVAARSATIDKQDALGELRTLGGQLIKIIRAFAIQTDDPGVYALAGIPAPKTPEPIAPVNPSDLSFTLDTSGALLVRWKGVKSNGTMFTVWRSIKPGANDPATPLTPVASVGEKEYLDTTIPAGAVSATYVIRALKGNQVTGGSAPATVNFIYSLNDGQQQLAIAA